MAWFQSGGIGMWVVLAATVLVGCGGGLAFLLAIVGWFVRQLRVVARMAGALAVFACVLPMVVGVAASAYGRYVVQQALPFVEPEQRDEVAAVGFAEAKVPTVFGSGMSCLVLMPAALAAVVALAIPAPRRPEDDEA